jgi:hypothetical protein
MSFVRFVAATSIVLVLAACSPFGGEKAGEAPDAASGETAAAPAPSGDDAAKPDEGGATADAPKPDETAAPTPAPDAAPDAAAKP